MNKQRVRFDVAILDGPAGNGICFELKAATGGLRFFIAGSENEDCATYPIRYLKGESGEVIGVVDGELVDTFKAALERVRGEQ